MRGTCRSSLGAMHHAAPANHHHRATLAAHTAIPGTQFVAPSHANAAIRLDAVIEVNLKGLGYGG